MIIYHNLQEIDQNLLHQILEYRDGELYWKNDMGRAKKGDKAGTMNKKYRIVKILRKHFAYHRLIFCMHHGYFPKIVDHIDGNTNNNRIENLRPANSSENNCNSKIRNNNSSGVKGVHWSQKRQRWISKVVKGGVMYHRSYHRDLESATRVVREVREKLHGEYTNHG